MESTEMPKTPKAKRRPRAAAPVQAPPVAERVPVGYITIGFSDYDNAVYRWLSDHRIGFDVESWDYASAWHFLLCAGCEAEGAAADEQDAVRFWYRGAIPELIARMDALWEDYDDSSRRLWPTQQESLRLIGTLMREDRLIAIVARDQRDADGSERVFTAAPLSRAVHQKLVRAVRRYGRALRQRDAAGKLSRTVPIDLGT